MRAQDRTHRAAKREGSGDLADFLRRDSLDAALNLVDERSDALPQSHLSDLSGVDVEAERLSEKLRLCAILFTGDLFCPLQERRRDGDSNQLSRAHGEGLLRV